VEDVRPWLSKAWLNIIPLELSSGFRGRVIELMAMGIPVVGTHNALESIGLENGKNGFISDSDDEITSFCLNLLTNHILRNEISLNARDFVKKNYSLESTFGKLNEYLKTKYLDGSN
jgi:glycosyltransferase involved in cell wall biosynthesis